MKRILTILSIMLLIFILGACGSNNDSEPADNNEDTNENSDEKDFENETVDDSGKESHSKEESDVESDDKSQEDEINVTLNDVDGNEAAKATLTPVDDGVKVKLVGDGLPEEKAKHGFHVHEKGVCEPRDFESAGGHYNPTDKNHGKEDVDGPHAGDFDNIEVDANGEVDVEFTTDQISLDENAENTVYSEDGTALVIHAGPDDYKSQPSGDAGDRIACGVIAEPK